jgi:hypothetical protein
VKTTIVIFGIVIALLGLLGIIRPGMIREFGRAFRSGGMLYLAATLRLALGVVLLLAAPGCRFTVALYVIGLLTLTSGLMLPFLGAKRFAALIDWGIGRSDGLIRGGMAAAILLGVFLVVAAS